MKCRKVQRRLSAYQDGELNPMERQEIGRHLLTCRACGEEYEKLRQVWQALGWIKELRPDPWFYRQLVRKMKEPRERGLFPSLQHVFQLIGAPAIASIILGIGLVAGIYLGGNLAQRNLFSFQNDSVSDSQSSFFTSMRVFDPAPPGTFAEGYLRMASYEESGSR